MNQEQTTLPAIGIGLVTGCAVFSLCLFIGFGSGWLRVPHQEPSINAMGFRLASGLNQVSIASTDAAQNLPPAELRTFIEISRQTVATRDSLQAFYNNLHTLGRMVDEAAQTGSPQWRPIQTAVNNLTEATK